VGIADDGGAEASKPYSLNLQQQLLH